MIRISRILTESQENPIGLDEERPRFSWLFQVDEEEKNIRQSAYRIRITRAEEEVWDTGKIESDSSQNIEYKGEKLQPCTKYQVWVTAWDNCERQICGDTFFETGFLDASVTAWDGAQWIGAPRYTVYAPNRGVFGIESEFRIPGGCGRAGIVFGANDERLLDHTKNELGMEGKNYIRYEINLTENQPRLDIYRVGYAPGDREEIPWKTTELVNFTGDEKKQVINQKNAEEFHRLYVEVQGNTAYCYVDDVLVDACIKEYFFGSLTEGTQLNPRGANDVLTYPRLNEIGFFAGKNTRAEFKNLSVRNLRTPGNKYICETTDGNLYGEKSVFADKIKIENQCFIVENNQITTDPSNTAIPMFRTTFEIKEKKLKKARLYITARGIYECMINGQPITERCLAPGLTQYNKRMNYQTFDITGFIQSGKNGIGVTLASGWWSEAQTYQLKNFNYFGEKEALLAKIILEYDDQSRQIIVTDPITWRYFGEGPYRFAGFFAGEVFDARLKNIYEEYSKASYDDSQWEAPEVITPASIEQTGGEFGQAWPALDYQDVKLEGAYDAPVYIVEERPAVRVSEVEKGVYIYDLEQEMAGVPRIYLREKRGTKVMIRYAEVLYPDLPESGQNVGKMMLENYRDATSVDIYICSGEEREVYQPKFTFHGYRYIEITGVTHPPEVEEVVSLQYSSVREFDGKFESDNALLNRFAENIFWSQKCNFINIPTDCPQRNERMGWAGDTHVFCHTALQNSNLKLFYERNLQAMADLQTEEGRFPEIAPSGGGFGGITYESAGIYIAWELYLQYGDKRTLKKFYQGMVRFMEYLKTCGLPEKINEKMTGPIDDWLALEPTESSLVWNAFYYRNAVIMSRISNVLKEEKNILSYTKLAEKIRRFWNKTYVDPDTGRTRNPDGTLCDTQCSYALGIVYDLAEDKEHFGRYLAEKCKMRGNTIGTGFFGTGILNVALSDTGHTETAYDLMLQTQYPSWLYPVTQGATTIWEHGDSYTKERGFNGQNAMNSFNHYSLGSVLAWMYQVILGINRDESTPGYQKIHLKPQPSRLKYAKGSTASPYGKIEVMWKMQKDGEFEYCCEIPVNTVATVYLPDKTRVKIGSGKHSFRCKISE